MTKDFFEALSNIFIFIPHFFSVPFLLRTLFAPWKNLTSTKETVGFSFADFFDRLGFDLISRFMGALMRCTLLFAYFLTVSAYIVLLPFIIISYFLLIPILLALARSALTQEDKRARVKASFVKSHTMKAENAAAVEAWFESYYKSQFMKEPWWKLSSLLAIPPLGRDWTAGYTPTLDQFTTDLATWTRQSQASHMVDREHETDQIARALVRTEGGNVLVVGEEGVGRHTIILALAAHIYEGLVAPALSHKRVLELEMEKILSSSEDQKVREATLEALLQEAATAHNIILVINNFDNYVATSKGRVDISLSLEKFLNLESLHFIGITTPRAFEQYVQSNDKIVRHFEKIEVHEVSEVQARAIILDYAPRLEARYRLVVPYETISAALAKSESFVTQFPYPEKVMKILDEACILAQTQAKGVVAPDLIDTVLGETAHVATTLTEDLRQKLLALEPVIRKRVLRQDEAIKRLSGALSTAFVSLGSRKKPLATLLFMGPTGVGKTETAKALAAHLFGAESALVRFDMSLYQTQADIAKLVGEGDTSPGLLTIALREKPYCVLLLDEIEKAHPDLLNIFLTLLDEGYMTDTRGTRVNAKNTIVIATSNAASESVFKPEFLNRFDAIVGYRPLAAADMQSIAAHMVLQITARIYKQHKITVTVSPALIQSLIEKEYNPAYGARDLARVLDRTIEGHVAELLLKREVAEGGAVQL